MSVTTSGLPRRGGVDFAPLERVPAKVVYPWLTAEDRIGCLASVRATALTPATQPIPRPRDSHSTWYTNRSKVRQ